MQPDIIGKAHPLSGRIYMEAATQLGETIIRDVSQELYGDKSHTKIPYVTLACEGAFIAANMARRGAIVQLPHYTLNGEADGLEALESLG